MDKDQKAQKMASIVLEVYTYALDNSMDITSSEEVKKMLEILELEIPPDVTVDTLVQSLIAFHKMTKGNVEKIKEERKKIPN